MMINADMKVPAVPLFCAGVAGMARAGSPNSANSQFFLMTARNDALDGNYTVLGRVVGGMDAIKALKKGSDSSDGAVGEGADTITRARLASQLPENERPDVRVAVAGGAVFNAAVEAARTARGSAFDVCDVEIPVEIGTR